MYQINLKRCLFVMALICVVCAILRRPITQLYAADNTFAVLSIGFYHWFWLFGCEGWFEPHLPLPRTDIVTIGIVVSAFLSIVTHIALLVGTVCGIEFVWKKLA